MGTGDAGASRRNRYLSDDTDEIPAVEESRICDHPQFEYKCIGRELSGWKPLQIHVCFYLAVKLLTFPMGMIQIDDFLIRVTKVCTPCFNFNIGNKVELTILIYGSFYNLVSGTECILCIELLTGNGFPVTAYIDDFSVSWTGYIPAVLLCHFKPVICAFPAKVSLDNEKTVCIHQNSNIVDGVISRIKADHIIFLTLPLHYI